MVARRDRHRGARVQVASPGSIGPWEGGQSDTGRFFHQSVSHVICRMFSVTSIKPATWRTGPVTVPYRFSRFETAFYRGQDSLSNMYVMPPTVIGLC